MPPSAVDLPHLKTYNAILDRYTLEEVSTEKGTARKTVQMVCSLPAGVHRPQAMGWRRDLEASDRRLVNTGIPSLPYREPFPIKSTKEDPLISQRPAQFLAAFPSATVVFTSTTITNMAPSTYFVLLCLFSLANGDP
ncbi:uncharacterized protein CCOS01_09305 [Colletotrichum costaricense]|uniref:Uncharacterized protein n=1 Tax=Colletotrichum costaricense TaxID=1209916 RepID=A0AAJ0DZM2_9PEZI|nr:uncharacterized protein CCOS01_09305 [Colletotrichum costaricense]KAK1524218.1 hypothetical protein CCOS01_09305 [Colletotrichum costaricense]